LRGGWRPLSLHTPRVDGNPLYKGETGWGKRGEIPLGPPFSKGETGVESKLRAKQEM
jgi:hypothetical protein